jgi:hypothetical protein
MANSENTAINDLIARVTGASAGTGPTADSPPPSGRMHYVASLVMWRGGSRGRSYGLFADDLAT